jgi:Zn-dependent protease with chaperone function
VGVWLDIFIYGYLFKCNQEMVFINVYLQEENLSAMNTDPWYSAYHYSHPPLVERLAALADTEKKES